MARRLGRVMLTSRRREIIEAAPIIVDSLSESEAVEFILDRAQKLSIKLLEKTSKADLSAAIAGLERRPIVLEALVRALADPATKRIDQAVSRVTEMLRRDLGEFLFADAWARLSVDLRRLLLLMTRVADVHDTQSLRICARIIGLSPQAAEAALEESGGIASQLQLNDSVQIAFSKNFLEFASEKVILLSGGATSPSESEILTARHAYSSFVQNAQKFSGDRIVLAFRTPQARAAHRARQLGQHEDAIKLYEQAILTDSTNGWLFNRFTSCFTTCGSIAKHCHAKRAIELLPSEGEPWYTRGLIEARLGDFRACELSMANAERDGIEPERCSMQRAWAYLKTSPAQIGLAEREIQKLSGLTRSFSPKSRQRVELERLEGRLATLKARKG